jgi:hypothetical protein
MIYEMPDEHGMVKLIFELYDNIRPGGQRVFFYLTSFFQFQPAFLSASRVPACKACANSSEIEQLPRQGL